MCFFRNRLLQIIQQIYVPEAQNASFEIRLYNCIEMKDDALL